MACHTACYGDCHVSGQQRGSALIWINLYPQRDGGMAGMGREARGPVLPTSRACFELKLPTQA
jgi:hypothetical protein